MSHKELVRRYCMEYLQSRSLSYCFNESEFQRMWRSQKDKQCNAYTCGLSTADNMILHAKPQPYDGGNEN